MARWFGWKIFAFGLAPACVLAGCDYLPGTRANQEAGARRMVAKLLIDPSSAQFRSIETKNEVVCGEINAKNKMGGFVGFKRFLVHLGNKQAQIDPEFDLNDLLRAEDLCRSMRGNSYSSLSATNSSCEREVEQRVAQSAQSSFDIDWRSNCALAARRSVYRPPLAELSENATINADVQPTPEVSSPTSSAASDGLLDEASDDGSSMSLVDSDGNAIDAQDAGE